MMDWRFPEEVKGALSKQEGQLLMELSRGKTVLEVGSFAGRSTISMAQLASRVHSVDWHKGDKDVGDTFTLASLIANLTKYGLRDKVCVYTGDSRGVLPLFRAGSLDVAFIDGGHDYETAIHDVKEAIRIVGKNGVVAVHDYNFPEVKRALDDLGMVQVDEQVGSLVVFQNPT